MILYHVTDQAHIPEIKHSGLNPGSYWSNSLAIKRYYEEVVADENRIPVVLTLNLTDLDPKGLEPDYPGLEEPLTYTLGITEDEVGAEWQASAKTWQDSLSIIFSCRYQLPIAAALLKLNDEPLVQLAKMKPKNKKPKP